MPGSGQKGDPGTDLIWLVRVTPGLANLSDRLANTMLAAQSALAVSGFGVRGMHLLSLEDAVPLADFQGTAISATSLSAVLAAAAVKATDLPEVVCTVSGLASVGQSLQAALGSADPPGALFVGLIDTEARPFGPSDAQCQIGGVDAATYFATPSWTNWSCGVPFKASQIRIAALASAEGVTDAEMRAMCAAQPGVDPSVSDVLQPSAVAFFGPWSAGVDAVSPGGVLDTDLCVAVSSLAAQNWTSFAKAWAGTLAP
jgi:hypothetical protein